MGRRSLGLLAVLLLMSPTIALSQVQGVWDCFNQTCQVLKARAGDTLDASSADSTVACKTGTSAPGTCAVGECFFDTDATAGVNLFGCTSSNTWTLLGDGGGGGGISGSGAAGQVTYWSGSSAVTGEAAFTYDATSNELDVEVLDVAGAADIAGDLTLSAGGDGALEFGVASSIKILDNNATSLVIEEDNNAYLTFDTANSGGEKISLAKTLDTAGVSFYPSLAASEAVTGNAGVLDFSPTWVPSTVAGSGKFFFNLLRVGGTAQVGAGEFTAAQVSILRLDPVFDVTSTTNANLASSVYGVYSQLENKTSASGGALSATQTTLQDSSIVSVNTSTDGTMAALYSHVDETTARTLSTGDVTVTSQASLLSAPKINAASSTTVTLTTRRGVWVRDIGTTGSGTKAVGTQVGVDIEELALGTSRIGLRNAGTTVTPPMDCAVGTGGPLDYLGIGLTTDRFCIGASFVKMILTQVGSAGNVAPSGTAYAAPFSASPSPQEGQCVTYYNSHATLGLLFRNLAGILQTQTGSDYNLAPKHMTEFCYMGYWIQVE